MGYKVQSQRMNFMADVFRIRRPFADVVETSATAGYNCGGATLIAGQICENDQIVGQQINYGAEAMLSGNITHSLRITGGITALSPKLTHTFVLLPVGNQYVSATCTDPTGVAKTALVCQSYVTNNKTLVGIPDYKSNILAEYQIPKLTHAYFNFDWQHVGRRPVNDMNSYYVPQYNTFDLGGRYTARVFGKVATWIVTFNNVSNVHYWSISSFFASEHRPSQVRFGNDYTYEDIRSSPAILVGAYNNPWADRVMSDLPFVFRESGEVLWIEDRTKPGQTWKASLNGRLGSKDFALVARMLNSKTGQFLVIVSGVGMVGTKAAGKIITHEEDLKAALSSATPGWEKKNLEFVIETDIVDTSPSPSHVVALKSW